MLGNTKRLSDVRNLMAEKPTPQQPKTATHCPATTRPWSATALKAVTKRQPRLAAVM